MVFRQTEDMTKVRFSQKFSDVLQALKLDLEMCCGYSFDGTSVMRGLGGRSSCNPDRNLSGSICSLHFI